VSTIVNPMLLVALTLLAAAWVAVAFAMLGICRAAAAGDRGLAAMRAAAFERDLARLVPLA
jgi:hypothetical protein